MLSFVQTITSKAAKILELAFGYIFSKLDVVLAKFGVGIVLTILSATKADKGID